MIASHMSTAPAKAGTPRPVKTRKTIRITMGPELRIMEDDAELAAEAADLFVWLAEQAVAAAGLFRVALSGGSTPAALYAALAGPPFSGQVNWPLVEFYFGDERCVPLQDSESNFGCANDRLFRPLKIAADRIFRMAGEASDPAQAAWQYETLLRERFKTLAPGWPAFDLILLGLGEDGHTASLFPATDALTESRRLVLATVSPRGVRDRLTLTVPVINQASTVIFLVSGPNKARAVRAVLEDQGADPRQWPGKLIRPVKGRLIWIVDRAAAAELAVARQGIVSHEE